jgi:methyl-accepting chemotaxis protein
MEEIVEAVKRVTDIMSEISTASSEQSAGIEQVNLAVTKMDEGTQHNAALVEEAAAAAESLEEQAVTLVRPVGVFRMNGSGAGGQPARPTLAAHGKTAARAPSKPLAPMRTPSAGPVEAEEFFDKAVAYHTRWRNRLRAFLYGSSDEKLDPAQVAEDNCCDLGKWIYGEGKRYQSDPEYTALKANHARFHVCASNVVKRVLKRDMKGAEAMFSGEFQALSQATVAEIVKMKRMHASGAAGTPGPSRAPATQTASAGADDWQEF